MNNSINITDGQLGVAFSESLLTNFIVVKTHGKQTVIIKPQPKMQVEFTDASFDAFFAQLQHLPPDSDKEHLRKIIKFSVEFLNQFWSWDDSKQKIFVSEMEYFADAPDETVKNKSNVFLQLAQMGLSLQATRLQIN